MTFVASRTSLFLRLGCIAAFLAVPWVGAQESIAGNWQGTLDAGSAKLRLVLHLKAADNGALTGTLDSIDQGAKDIPVTSIALDGAKFVFVVDAVHGSYAGTVNADTSRISGIWTQAAGKLKLDLMRMPAAHLSTAPAKPVTPSEIDGTWAGSLTIGQDSLRILIRLSSTADGLAASLQSPDQSPVWIPASSVVYNGASVKLGFQGIGATFDGKLAEQPNSPAKSLAGTFTQSGASWPLTLKPIR